MPEKKRARERVSLRVRLRRAALYVLFALVLLIPQTLALRRHRRGWNALRLGLALTGVALLVAVRNQPSPGGSAIIALLLILLALLVPPVKEGKSVDEQARELGALVVVNGGRFRSAGAHSTPARLFVAPERVHVLDLQHRPLLEIPLGAISALRVEEAKEAKEAKDNWGLRVEWEEGSATFYYEGFFAEHLARVAETTLRSQLHRELRVVR